MHAAWSAVNIAASMTAGTRPSPSTRFEEASWACGEKLVAGVDEVGRGPLAGPVYAAAVILDRKMLSELAIHDPAAFDVLVDLAKQNVSKQAA